MINLKECMACFVLWQGKVQSLVAWLCCFEPEEAGALRQETVRFMEDHGT